MVWWGSKWHFSIPYTVTHIQIHSETVPYSRGGVPHCNCSDKNTDTMHIQEYQWYRLRGPITKRLWTGGSTACHSCFWGNSQLQCCRRPVDVRIVLRHIVTSNTQTISTCPPTASALQSMWGVVGRRRAIPTTATQHRGESNVAEGASLTQSKKW